MELSKTDTKIVRLIKQRGWITPAELGQKFCKNEDWAARRLVRLRDDGIVVFEGNRARLVESG